MLVDLKLPPGVSANGTAREAKGRWRDARFVRWVEGVAQPVGKWARISPTPLAGRVSGIQPLRDNSQRQWLIVGTNRGIYVLADGPWMDVTPVGFVKGIEITSLGDGYGAADYNEEEYGTERTGTTSLFLEADTWSLATWGEFVVGVSVGDGVARVWKPGAVGDSGPDVEFAPITNAPIDNRALLVTNERHLMLIGAGGDPRKVQWSAREDYTEWAPTAINLAGALTLETVGTLQAGIKVADDVVVLSEVDAFRISYVGQPYGYGRDRIGTNCGVIGPRAAVATNDFGVWMGNNGFWMYRGQLQPLPCDVQDYVFRDLNRSQRVQIECGLNAEHDEVWWFFPKGEALRNTHYVAWNYRDNWWSVGELSRTAWARKGMWSASTAAGADGHIYEHELAVDAPGVEKRAKPYLESGPFELGSGDKVVSAMQLIPDQDCRTTDALQYDFASQFTPTGADNTFGPYFPDADGYTDVRFTGRSFRWTISAKKDVDWRIGVLRADIKQGGRR